MDYRRLALESHCLKTDVVPSENEQVYRNIDNMSLAGHVADAIRKVEPDAVFVDAGGGQGVIDRLRQLGHPIMEVNFGGKPRDAYYQDKRTEMWFGIKHWLEQGGRLANIPELKSDLVGPTYEFLASGKVRLESKDKLKARGMSSPDLGDALALTFAMPVSVQTGAQRQEWAIEERYEW